MDAIQAAGGRHVPPEICPDRESLTAHMGMMHKFCIEILDRESPESIRELKCLRLVDVEAWREDSPERPIDLWRMLADLHPYGVHENPEAPGHFPMELIAVIRQITGKRSPTTGRSSASRGFSGSRSAATFRAKAISPFPNSTTEPGH